MNNQKWVDFWFREFHEYPRALWFMIGVETYHFNSAWNKEDLTYDPFYVVSRKEYNKYRELCAVPVASVDFDKSRKKLLDASILDQILFNK